MTKVYIETYGCQMNEYDTELIRSILDNQGYDFARGIDDADVIFINTCAIRENAHSKIYGRLGEITHLKRRNKGLVVGLLGCMSQNLRGKINRNLDLVDIFAGPDSYKRLPAMIQSVLKNGKKSYDFSLSEFEDYSDVYPQRVKGVNAWIAVMRGCDNFCSFCVVPYTRGRERSRTPQSVVDETRRLAEEGFKQITLLGQNVNSYQSLDADFADLMEHVAAVDGVERVRFTSPHPKDFPQKFIDVMAKNPKICNHIHLPLQSGSDRVLALMNRTYTSKSFLQLVDQIRDTIPNITLTTDVIVGFPTETDADFSETLMVMEQVEFDSAFMFKYSERKQTTAYKNLSDDVTANKKTERIVALNDLQREISLKSNERVIGSRLQVLVEGPSKKDSSKWMTRSDGNKTVIVRDDAFRAGEMVDVMINRVSPNTLFGSPVQNGSITGKG